MNRPELFNIDGYPTVEALAALETFRGSPADMAGYVGDLVENYGSHTIKPVESLFYGTEMELSLTTGGWSGNEEVVSVLSRTLFHIGYWESSHRGGLHTYQVPVSLWEVEGFWGNPLFYSEEDQPPPAAST